MAERILSQSPDDAHFFKHREGALRMKDWLSRDRPARPFFRRRVPNPEPNHD